MPGMYAEAIPQIGANRIVVDVSDWASLPDETQLMRSTVPPTDPDWYLYAKTVRVRPTYVIGALFPQGGYPWEMISGGVDVWYDTEAPLGVPVYYRAEMIGGDEPYIFAHAAITIVSSDFEASVQSWIADTGGVVSHNVATPIRGAGSLRLTSNGTNVTIGTRSPTSASGTVVAGHRYVCEYELRAGAAATDIRVAADWKTAAGTFISSSLGATLTAPAGVVVRRRQAFLAPATAARIELRARWSGTPPAAAVIDLDRARAIDMGDAEDEITANTVTLTEPGDGGGWLSKPTSPAEDIALRLLPDDDCDPDTLRAGVIFASHAAEVRAGAGARFDVVQQAVPSVVTGTRKAPTSTLTLAALTFPDRDTVHSLHADGDVLMLRLPAEYGIADRFLDVADLTTSPLSPNLRLPYRVIDIPYAEAGSPGAPIDGVLGTRFADLDRYATWAAFDAANLTSIDLLLGYGSTLGVGAL